jgi:hypothetical protein
VDAVPAAARATKDSVLASGDSTGHRHRIKDRKTARVFTLIGRTQAEFFVEVVADQAEIVHPEHDTITLPRGTYRVWRQRELTDSGFRPIGD